jgi:hypothetical protein
LISYLFITITEDYVAVTAFIDGSAHARDTKAGCALQKIPKVLKCYYAGVIKTRSVLETSFLDYIAVTNHISKCIQFCMPICVFLQGMIKLLVKVHNLVAIIILKLDRSAIVLMFLEHDLFSMCVQPRPVWMQSTSISNMLINFLCRSSTWPQIIIGKSGTFDLLSGLHAHDGRSRKEEILKTGHISC